MRSFMKVQWWLFRMYILIILIYIYICVCVLGGEEPPWTQSILVWEGYGGELTHGNSGDSAGCLGYPYSLSALIFRVETSRLDIMCIYIYITWHNMFTICNMDIVCIYIYIHIMLDHEVKLSPLPILPAFFKFTGKPKWHWVYPPAN